MKVKKKIKLKGEQLLLLRRDGFLKKDLLLGKLVSSLYGNNNE